MDYFYDPRTTFHLVDEYFLLSINPPNFNIQFHFTIETKYTNRYLNHDSSLPWFSQSFPASSAAVSASVPVGGILAFEEVEAAVGGALGSLVPPARGRLGEFTDRAWERVCESLSDVKAVPRECDLHLAFHVAVEQRHVYVVEGESPFAIPAAEAPAFELLEEHVEEEERCCCVCLEEIGGGGRGEAVVRMPCQHAFHGGCIKKWLRKRPSCPLCRYEMPMI